MSLSKRYVQISRGQCNRRGGGGGGGGVEVFHEERGRLRVITKHFLF